MGGLGIGEVCSMWSIDRTELWFFLHLVSAEVRRRPEVYQSPSKQEVWSSGSTDDWEKTQLRALLGGVSWHALQLAPHFAADVGFLLSEVNKSTIDTIYRANKLLDHVKSMKDHRMKIHPIPKEELAAFVWVDAGSQNRPDGSSTQGIVVGVASKDLLDGQTRFHGGVALSEDWEEVPQSRSSRGHSSSEWRGCSFLCPFPTSRNARKDSGRPSHQPDREWDQRMPGDGLQERLWQVGDRDFQHPRSRKKNWHRDVSSQASSRTESSTDQVGSWRGTAVQRTDQAIRTQAVRSLLQDGPIMEIGRGWWEGISSTPQGTRPSPSWRKKRIWRIPGEGWRSGWRA